MARFFARMRVTLKKIYYMLMVETAYKNLHTVISLKFREKNGY